MLSKNIFLDHRTPHPLYSIEKNLFPASAGDSHIHAGPKPNKILQHHHNALAVGVQQHQKTLYRSYLHLLLLANFKHFANMTLMRR